MAPSICARFRCRKVLAALLLLPCAFAAPVSIRMEAGVFKVAPPGAKPVEGWSSIFAVYAGDGDLPPMLGSYAVESGALIFRPRFPLAPGVRARAVFHPQGGAEVVATFEAPKAESPASRTRVEHVYPSTDILPDNQLKFYVYFSSPMRRGEAWQHIHLLRENGKAVELPFLELDQELWDREYKRFTVLFDPGRIKRGLLPLEEAGQALEEGKQYTLVIDRDWLDAGGGPLEADFRKPFHVGPADRTPPDTAQWRLTPPKAGTTGALIVDFPKAMDYALLLRLLEVPGVRGKATVGQKETEWRFVPELPWKAGAYNLVVNTELEDLAGNRIGRAFDVDTFERVTGHIEHKTASLPFRIGRD
jgi:hypothetical protein